MAAAEILRSDLLQELPELLDLVLLLVRDGYPGLVQHLVAAEDRGSGAKRERDGIRRARAHLDAAEVKLRIEDAAAVARPTSPTATAPMRASALSTPGWFPTNRNRTVHAKAAG